MRVLLVGTGAPGGIGRVEQMMAEAILHEDRDATVDVRALWRSRHPAYLREGAIERLPTVTDAAIAGNREYVVALARAIRAFRPDHVVYQHVNLARPAPWLRAIGHPRRYAVWTYGVEVWDRLSLPHRLALRNAEVLFTISRYSTDRLVAIQGVPREQTRIVPLTLPAEMFAAASAAHADPRPGELLTVARLASTERGKHLDELIAAMPHVRRAMPEARLRIVGDGDDRARLEGLAAKLGVADVVTFAGRVSDAELGAAYARADVFVLPSEKEGFGLVFVEAMLRRTPVIGAAAGGTVDVVRDGLDGVLVRDVADLPAAITGLLADRPAVERMRAAAYDHARTDFSPAAFRAAVFAALGTPRAAAGDGRHR